MKYYGNKAYTMLEFLIVCLMISIIILLITPIFKTIQKRMSAIKPNEIVDNMRIQQMLAQSEIISITPYQITLRFNHEDVKFIIHRNRIVKTPGYHILKTNVHTNFVLNDECIFVNEERLYCEKGLR